MPQNVTQYNLLISCPGDIKEEIEVINRTVQKFNDQFSDTLGISIRTRHWSKNSYPQSGGSPQELLNEQFVKKCDAAVALFWTRFGTPTDEYGSGTEEEIEIMLDSGKQVFLYFSEKPVAPSDMDTEGYTKVQDLKERYKKRGIYFSYSTAEEFERLFYAHLTQYYIKKSSEDTQPKRTPQLVLHGINADGRLCEAPASLDFKFNTSKGSKERLAEIKELYRKINAIHLRPNLSDEKETGNTASGSPLVTKHFLLFSPMKIDEETKKAIISVAQHLKIELSDDFFFLGNLSKNTIDVSMMGGYNCKGTADEKQKYKLIIDLYGSISELISWLYIEEAYTGLTCIQLAIENSGTAVDEDVEVELRFNKDILLPSEKFPEIEDEYAIEYLMDECDLGVLLSIPPTAQYKAYEDSQKSGSYAGTTPNLPPLGLIMSRNYHEEFRKSIADIYCYEIFAEKDQCIMKVKFDYIRHHTVIAFPTPIFLRQVPTEIEYTITSQNSPDILSGKLLVQAIDKED